MTVVLIVALGSAVFLQSLTAHVVDQTGAPLADVVVRVRCANGVETSTTNHRGEVLVAPGGVNGCFLSAAKDGFDSVAAYCSLGLGQGPCRLVLPVATLKEHIEVRARADTLALAAAGDIGSSRFGPDDLRVLGPDLSRWIDVAERAAGRPIGAVETRIGGVATAVRPPVVAGSVSINSDPFGIERSGADRLRVDITPTVATARWHVHLRPPSLRTPGRELLLGGAGPQSRDAGVTGGFATRGRVALELTSALEDRRSIEHPTYIEGPVGTERLAASVKATGHAQSAYLGITVRTSASEIAYAAFLWNQVEDNAGVGGPFGPSSAFGSERRGDQHQVVWRVDRGPIRLRGHGAIEVSDTAVRALREGPGLIVAGRLIGGPSDPIAFTTRRQGWQGRIVMEAAGPMPRWLVGVEAAELSVHENHVFNPDGQVHFFASGAPAGKSMRSGTASTTATERTAGVFAQRVVTTGAKWWLRLGARADWQQGYRIFLSPRLSAATTLGAFVVAGNAGLFVDAWTAGQDVEYRSRRDAPMSWVDPVLRVELAGAPPRRHDAVVRLSVSRHIGAVRLAWQESGTVGRDLAGLVRHRVHDRLIDRLRSDRSMLRAQSHLRADWRLGSWITSAHYVHTRSTDNTDGPLTLPARQALLAEERGPTTGVATHTGTVSAAGSVLWDVQILVVATVRSGTPYSRLTGEDPDGLFTFTGRTSPTRNADRQPGTRDVSLYMSRGFRVPGLGLAIQCGVRLENLTGQLAVLDIDTHAESALTGRAIRAGAGRQATAWFTLGR